MLLKPPSLWFVVASALASHKVFFDHRQKNLKEDVSKQHPFFPVLSPPTPPPTSGLTDETLTLSGERRDEGNEAIGCSVEAVPLPSASTLATSEMWVCLLEAHRSSC